MTPGWARTCTHEEQRVGFWCEECFAFKGAMPDDTAPHNTARTISPRPESLAPARTLEPKKPDWRGGTLRH